jgi:Relaxase/Mobilisation nuclease domain.
MISKRIHCEPQNDNIKRLGLYINAGHEGEKLYAKWTAGCYAGQDYDLAIDEIKATQGMNTRTKKEKTYHMVVSFHPEDFKKLSLEDFKNIEKEFAAALGFEDHQRLCGIHINTDNPHMHVAYNMIHKEKYTRHDPFYDYYKRDKTCRILEEKYNLRLTLVLNSNLAITSNSGNSMSNTPLTMPGIGSPCTKSLLFTA